MKKTTFSAKSILWLILCVVMAFSLMCVASAEDDHTHIYGEWVVTTPATCSQTGIKTKTCLIDGCGSTVEETVEKDSLNHAVSEDAEWTVALDTTCATNGRMETTCASCGKTVAKVVPAYGHNFTEDGWKIISEATCTADGAAAGVRQQYCDVCNKTITETYEPTHTYEDKENWTLLSKATCKSYASYSTGCTVCGNTTVVYGDEYAQHVFSGEPYYITEPTCVSKGIGIDSCDVCGKIVVGMTVGNDVDTTDPTAELNEKYHTFDYSDVINSGTCSFDLVKCTTCKGYIEMPYEEYSNHNFITSTHKSYEDYPDEILTNASCITEGITKKYCLDCKEYIEVKSEKNDSLHKISTVVLKKATCTTDGLRMQYCELDYGHIWYTVIPATGHTYTKDWEIVKHPTCLEDGLKVNFCTTCKVEIEETLKYTQSDVEPYENKHIHNFDNATEVVLKKATCTEEGAVQYYCNDCQRTITLVLPTHYSSIYEYQAQKDATCCLEGAKYYICKECSEYINEVIPVDLENGHVYRTVTSATCIAEGKAVCLRNSRHTSVLAIDDTAHSIGEWTVTDKPACEAEGTKQSTCTLCFATVTDTVPATGHTAGSWRKTQGYNCENGGTLVQYCVNCPKLLGEKKVEATAHTFTGEWEFISGSCTEGGTIAQYCTVCGYEDKQQSPAGTHVATAIIQNVAATCQKQGYDLAVCACGQKQVKINTTPTAAHAWIVMVKGVEATCTENGVADERYCMNCTTLTGGNVISALGHDFVADEEGGEACSRCYISKVGTDDAGDDITCTCMCHKSDFLTKIIFKIVNFFNKLFKKNQLCECGFVEHY